MPFIDPSDVSSACRMRPRALITVIAGALGFRQTVSEWCELAIELESLHERAYRQVLQ